MERVTYDEYRKALEVVKKYRDQCVDVIKESELSIDKNSEQLNIRLLDTELSVRALNSLIFGYGLGFDSKVIDLSNVSRSTLLRVRNFGKKSLDEIEELCYFSGIKMRP